MDQGDGDRLDVDGRDLAGDRLDLALVQLAPDLATRAEALLDLESVPSGHERRRALVLHVVEDRYPQASHLEDIAKSLGRDEGGAGTEALEDRVRGDGRRMDDSRDVVASDAALAKQCHCAVDDAARIVVRRGKDLLRPHRAVVTEEDDVGEGPTDVDSEAVGADPGRGRRRG